MLTHTRSDYVHTCEKQAIDYTLLVPALKCLFDNGCQRSLIDGNIALLNKIAFPGSYHILRCEFLSQHLVWTPYTVWDCHWEHVGMFSFWIFTSSFDLSSPCRVSQLVVALPIVLCFNACEAASFLFYKSHPDPFFPIWEEYRASF